MLVVTYGKDIEKNTYDTLKVSDIGLYLESGMTVAIKPNLVVPSPAITGATTHPEVVEGVIRFLKDFGVRDIKIIESSWVGDSTKRAFEYCGYNELAKKHGIPLVDIKSDSSEMHRHGEYAIDICDEAMNTDFLINIPVLKAHCQTKMTCCMKNLKGCIPDSEKRRFHTLGIHKPVAVLNALLKTGYCVVDGICGDLSFEEGGNPVESNRIIAGRNPLLVDSYCAELIGYLPDEIGYLAHGKELGLGEFYSQGTRVVELNPQNKPVHQAKSGRVAERFSSAIREDSACSACYSALVYALHRYGEETGEISIGQGFEGKSGRGLGIGRCAAGFDRNVPGCPPKATDILAELNR
ncbi:MAG: DUF362 domain-containing protein, partial [Oscillospiraceae bacterium]|nr:DUF362 domain-containing protein [Oscillospiraceae bacterium]